MAKAMPPRAAPLAARVIGSGPAVIFLHGSFSNADHAWVKQHALADRLKLILADRPGYGRTPPTPDRTILGQAASVAALAEELELPALHLVGWSYGGVVALAAALHLSSVKRLRSLTLIEPPLMAIAPDHPGVAGFLRRVQTIWRRAEAGVDPQEWVLEFLAEVNPPGDPDLPGKRAWPVYLAGTEPFIAEQRPHEYHPDPDRLRDLDVPTLLVTGENGAPWLHEITARLAALLPRARRLRVPGFAHGAQFNAEVFNAALFDHVKAAETS